MSIGPRASACKVSDGVRVCSNSSRLLLIQLILSHPILRTSDCVPGYGYSCHGKPKQPWDKTFSTARECCKANLSWVNEEYCVGKSTETPYYPVSTYQAPPEYYPPQTPPAYTQSKHHGRNLRKRAVKKAEKADA